MATLTTITLQRPTGEQFEFAGVVIANSFTARLRGWFGYQRNAHVSAVWLTKTNAVHTVGMSRWIDLMWLDKHGQCVHWEPQVKPAQWRYCHAAHQVIEWRSGFLAKDVMAFAPQGEGAKEWFITRTKL